MLILGLETSCDETSAAVVEDGRWVWSNVVSSQVPLHKKYGGVVPELASRAHLEGVLPITSIALDRAGKRLSDIDAIAVTRTPGLIGALMVGVHTAKAIAYATGKPLVGVDHIHAHIAAVGLADDKSPHAPELPFPHAALAVSGGHTAIYRVDGPLSMTRVGQTLDDAAGEAFDKVSTMLGLGYPGGRVIDDLAQTGNCEAIAFPRAWLKGDRKNDFSFSGLKTAVKNHIRKHGRPEGQALADLCASFQESVVHVIVKKTLRAAAEMRVQDVVLSGGVAANSRLRAHFVERAPRHRLRVHATPIRFCSDNAAMIAGLGYHTLKQGGDPDWFTMDARATTRTAS